METLPTEVNSRGLAGELQSKGVQVTPLRLILPENMPKEDWVAVGIQLNRADQVMQWWIGDWAAFGDRKYGDLSEFCKLNGLNYSTVSNRSTVSKSVHFALRNEQIPWSFYSVVAPLKPGEQKSWLSKVQKGGLSVSQLRTAINVSNGEHNALESDGPPPLDEGDQHFFDMEDWLHRRPSDFWRDRSPVWLERLARLAKWIEAKGTA